MKKIDGKIVGGIRKSLRLLGESIEKEPAIFIDAEDRYWFNDPAEKLIQKRGIPEQELTEWLSIGSTHLRQISCRDLGIRMLGLSEDQILVFLTRENKEPAEKFGLTRKEKEVLGHVVRGLTNRMIAEVMKISAGTVNSHLDKIYFKLGCSNRLAACYIALRNGLFLGAGDTTKMKER